MLLISTYMQIELLDKVRHGLHMTQSQALANDGRQRLAVLFRATTYIVSGIVFLMWFYRVYRNLPSLGAASTEYSPGWAVGWWFVPFASLVVPCQISKEIWKGSHPANLGVLSKARIVGSPLVGVWWAFWLIMILIGSYSGFWMPAANSLDQVIAASWVAVMAMLATLPAGVLAILFVYGVDSNQTKRHDLCLQGQAISRSDFDDTPVGDWQTARDGGEQFTPPASRPPAASGGSGEGIDDWLNKL
jgi:hypothetical protein